MDSRNKEKDFWLSQIDVQPQCLWKFSVVSSYMGPHDNRILDDNCIFNHNSTVLTDCCARRKVLFFNRFSLNCFDLDEREFWLSSEYSTRCGNTNAGTIMQWQPLFVTSINVTRLCKWSIILLEERLRLCEKMYYDNSPRCIHALR